MSTEDGSMSRYLNEGRPLLGVLTGIPSPGLVEMAGHARFDFVVIDNEHGPAGVETTEHLIRAARCAGVAPIVRVSGANTQEILRTLDAGAAGVQVPQVNTAEQARLVVAAAKFPPEGNRGIAFSTRSAAYGFSGGIDYVRAANQQNVIITHVETVEAVEHLDGMLAVTGINVIFVGPTDLSVSMGYPGNPGHPEVQAVIARTLRRIAAAGIAPGVLCTSADDFHRFAAMGARYLVFNLTSLICAAMRATVAEVRREG